MNPGIPFLAVAIVAEVVATTALKASAEFTRWGPTTLVAAGYGTAFYCLAVVLRTIPLGVAYALWSGLGIVLVALAGAVVYRQLPDAPALLGIALIVAGAVVINVWSDTSGL